MKKVVLIGDSIRMGYDKYVKDALDGVAEVLYPEENCRFCQYVLRNAHVWKRDLKWGDDVDLVHWNAGAWDLIELFGDEPLTPIEFYGQLVGRIDKRLRMLFPNAKIVFATNTHFLEKYGRRNMWRSNENIVKYNEVAKKVLEGTGTYINELYELTKNIPEEYREDSTHFFKPEATEIVGSRVLSIICNLLDIKPNQINIKDFNPENYSSDDIAY